MTTLLQDDFSEADSTVISAKSLDVGGTWTARNSSTAQVQSGKYAEQATGGSIYISDADAGQADADVSADFAFPADGYDGGVIARLTDGTNYWALVGEKLGVLDRIRIYEINGGTETARATLNSPGLAGGTHSLKLTCSGTTVTGYVDGVQVITYASATFNQTATRFGLRNYRDGSFGQVPADNFLVTGTVAATSHLLGTLGVGA